MDTRIRWTEQDFDEMSWHDNHFHGIQIAQGEYGPGTVSFDIDYILAWVKLDSGAIGFSIAPATLTFRDVTNLVLNLDYAKSSAALCPFSADSIERIEERRDRYIATLWRINVNWPEGTIGFEAPGFEQRLRAEPVISDQQVLSAEQRGGL